MRIPLDKSAGDIKIEVAELLAEKGPSHEKFQNVADRMFDHIKSNATFYRTDHDLYMVTNDRDLLFTISKRDPKFIHFMGMYDISVADKHFAKVIDTILHSGRRIAKSVTIHNSISSDPATHTVYFQLNDREVVKISPEKIETVKNGTDSRLFLSKGDDNGSYAPSQEWSKTDVPPFDKYLIIPLADVFSGDDHLSEGDCLRVFELWIYSLFFPGHQPTKPILAMLGPPGSGKTSTLTRVIQTVLGPDCFVSSIGDKNERDFNAEIAHSHLIVCDNIDRSKSWIPEKLATLATGGTVSYRKLYSDGQVVTITPQCFIAITSNNPKFAQSDVADRSIIIHSRRIPANIGISESVIRDDIKLNRPHILRDLFGRIHQICKKLSENTPIPASEFRMKDFFKFCYVACGFQGGEAVHRREIMSIFDKMSEVQAELAMENSPVIQVMRIYLEEKDFHTPVTLKEVHRDCVTIADQNSILFDGFRANFSAFSGAVGRHKSQIEKLCGFNIEVVRDPGKRQSATWHFNRISE